MKNRLFPLVFLAIALVGCNSRPDKVLDDDEMADLLVDIYKSEAIIDMNRSQYSNDSMKAVVKQSVFLKHGVTQEEYDSSLVWYSHNVPKYIKVYDDVISRLEAEEYELRNGNKPSERIIKRPKKHYPSAGDSADIWDMEREWIFSPQYGNNIMRFEVKSKMDDKDGDRYRLTFRLQNALSSVKVYLGADYYDGTTSYVYRNTMIDGENSYVIQSDSTKRIRRVYGYISAIPSAHEIMFVDSIILLRTRLDSASYSTFNMQKWIGPKRLNPATIRKQALEQAKKNAEDAKKEITEDNATNSNRPRRYTPKPGLNKSSHQSVR